VTGLLLIALVAVAWAAYAKAVEYGVDKLSQARANLRERSGAQ
jgi:hypothetical protein